LSKNSIQPHSLVFSSAVRKPYPTTNLPLGFICQPSYRHSHVNRHDWPRSVRSVSSVILVIPISVHGSSWTKCACGHILGLNHTHT